MPPKAKAKARGRATCRRRIRFNQLAAANHRQSLRRKAVKELNVLCKELLTPELQVPTAIVRASDRRVEQLIRALEPRCQTDALAGILRAAAQ